MGRRHKGDDSAVSLFSFLDIIACLIGVLSLILITLILSMVDPASIEAAEQRMAVAAARTKQVKELQSELKPLEEQEQELKEKIEQAEESKEQIEALKKKIEEIEAEQEGDAEQRKASRELQQQIRELEQEIQELEQSQQQMAEEIEETKAELEMRTQAAAAPDVQIKPGGTGENINPFFVEVTRTEIIIYGLDPEPIHVKPGQIREGPEFARLMQRVKQTPNGSIIFLMRSDALGMYYLASSTATNNYVKNGKLPVIGEGKIDLSGFESQVDAAGDADSGGSN